MNEWIETFRRHFSDKEILNPSYAIDIFEGRKYCKLCDAYFTGPSEDHLAIHAQELEEYNNQRKIETEKKKKETKEQREAERVALPKLTDNEFYAVPCDVCGKGIKRTGKRGRPPTKHEGCK